MTSFTPSELRFTRTERVTMGNPAAEVLVEQAEAQQGLEQRLVLLLLHPAQLQVGAVGQVDEPVGKGLGRSAEAERLCRAEPPEAGTDTDDQPVARAHWCVGAGAPSLDVEGAHPSRSSCARIELRRVCQRPDWASAANCDCMARNASGLASARKAVISASPSVASK